MQLDLQFTSMNSLAGKRQTEAFYRLKIREYDSKEILTNYELEERNRYVRFRNELLKVILLKYKIGDIIIINLHREVKARIIEVRSQEHN